MRKMTCALPLPPSANRLWRATRTGRNIRSEEYNKWSAMALPIAEGETIGRGFDTIGFGAQLVEVKYLFWLRAANSDLDNYVKATTDILQAANWLDNDNQVVKYEIELMAYSHKRPRVYCEMKTSLKQSIEKEKHRGT